MSSNQLRIAIAGAGLGGLTAARALLQKGFDVSVYEQAETLGEVGAGLQLAPNATRCLHAVGLGPALMDVAAVPTGKQVRLWNTGQSWKLFDLGETALREYGAPYVMVHRADLHRVLVDGVREIREDAIRLGSRLAGFAQDEQGVTLRFEDGSTETSDVLIASDGVHSVLRRDLGHLDRPEFTGCLAWRGLVPTAHLPARLREPVGTNWIGPGAHVITYPVRSGELLNFVGIVERTDWIRESWMERGSIQECLADFRGWHEDVQLLISLLDAPYKWALMGREPLDQWGAGSVTLLGDAAHPTLPFLAQGAGMAIEDGVVLARCLEAFPQDPTKGLRRYEELRIERTSRIVRGASEAGKRFHNPALADPVGAAAYVETEWSEERTRQRYDWLFSYDATCIDILKDS